MRQVPDIIVPGTPVPQGSMRSFERGGRIVTTANNAGRLERWRGDVRTSARAAMGDHQPTGGEVAMALGFIFLRPKSHLMASGAVRKGASRYPRADLDKLVRAVLDALTGIVYVDDCQVTSVFAWKSYGEREGVAISGEVDEEGK